MMNDQFSKNLAESIPNGALGHIHERLFYGILRRVDDVNMFVRLRAIQTMHNLIESSTKNLGKDVENVSGYFECMMQDQYFDAFEKIAEKISESATNVSMSAVKCVSSFLNNNR